MTDALKKQYNPTEAEQTAIALVTDELREWEDAICPVTDKIQIKMRKVIDTARKNYFGKYSKDREAGANSDKVWDPITEIMVDTVVQNIDLDPKDIIIKAKNPEHVDFANLARLVIKDQLHKIGFGEILDQIERFGAIDGTAVLKTFKWFNPKTKKNELKSYWVDTRNFYIDPNATNIQESDCLERSVLNIKEFKAYDWENLDYVEGKKDIPIYNDLMTQSRSQTPMVEVYERWGLMPKSLVTGKEEDADEYIDGHIVVSNPQTNAVVHLIEENKTGLKPYEEWWFKRVPNRWYGRGVAEMVMSHQAYANILINMRKNVNLTKGLGLYEIRRGSGIKPSDLKGLIESGGIIVERIGEDIRPFQDRDANYDQSMAESSQLYSLSQRVTGASDLAQGENLPATTSATSASIQNQQMSTRWDFIKESLGRFVQRVIERHYLPIIKEMLNHEEVLRVAGDSGFLKDYDERIITSRLNRAIANYVLENFDTPQPEQVEAQREVIKEQLKKQGTDRFIKNIKEIFNPDYDIEVHVTNEEMSKATRLQDLRDAMVNLKQIAPNMDTDALVEDWLDMLGMDTRRYFKGQQPQQMMPQGMPQGAPGGQQPSETALMAQAQQALGRGQPV